MKHVTDEPVPPRKRSPHVSEAMDAVVMGLLAKDPEDRCGNAFELAEDLRKARAGLPLVLAGAGWYPGSAQEEFMSTEGSVYPGSSQSAPTRRRPVAIGLVALATLLALLGAFGWDLTGSREGSKAVGTVTTTEGTREGGVPEAPEVSREGDSSKGVSSGMPSVELAGGAYVPASSSSASPSASASASGPASASPSASAPASASAAPQAQTSDSAASGPWASAPQASAPQASAPSGAAPSGAAPSASASPTPGGLSGSGGQDAGTTSTVVVESAAQEQYR